MAAHAGRALVERVGEQVVVHDHVARHAQGEQDEGGGKAGAVFAGGAVKHGGRIAGQQQSEELGKARCVVVHKAQVGLLHQPHGILRGELAAGALQVEGALDHGGLNGQRVVGHAGQRVGMGRAFGLAAKIYRAGHAQLGQQRLVLWRKARQMVGPKEPPPPHRPPTMARVAAQVAEVGDTGERERAGGAGGMRGGLLLHGQGAGVALKRKSPAYPMRVTCRVTRVRGAICVCAGGLNVSAAMR